MAKDKELEKGKETEAKQPAKASAKAKGAEKQAAPKKTKETAEAAPAKKGKKGERKQPRLAPRTYAAKPGEIPAKWCVVDAQGIPLGRLSTYIAQLLMGKLKAAYTRSSDTGDHVIVINAEKVVLTGKKWEQKTYHYHTGYPGGIKTFTAQDLRGQRPKKLVEWSVYGMLPKGHMGRNWYKKLWVYPGAEHPHQAQKPEMVKLPNLGFFERN